MEDNGDFWIHDWSFKLHCDLNHDFDLDGLNRAMFGRAKLTSEVLGLHGMKNMNILEIGCGIGHLSKHLAERHNVTSCDQLDYMKHNKLYQRYLHEFGWPRKHFAFRTPYDQFASENKQNFKKLESLGIKFDFIIWQNSDFLETKKSVTEKCLEVLISNLLQLMRHGGRLVLGFDLSRTTDIRSTRFYSFLLPWLEKDTRDYDIIGKYIVSLTHRKWISKYTKEHWLKHKL
jgi:SAM-dependent methyltransferase